MPAQIARIFTFRALPLALPGTSPIGRVPATSHAALSATALSCRVERHLRPAMCDCLGVDDLPSSGFGEGSGPGDPAAGRPRGSWGRLRRSGRSERRSRWWELPALIVAAVLVAVVVKSFVVQPFFIPSESMEHTLYGCPGCHGDRILVNKLIYDVREPHPGDIVVFHAPPGWNDEPASRPPSNPVLRAVRGFGQLIGVVPPDGEVLVKRVIATAGQTVRGRQHRHRRRQRPRTERSLPHVERALCLR